MIKLKMRKKIKCAIQIEVVSSMDDMMRLKETLVPLPSIKKKYGIEDNYIMPKTLK